MTLKARFIIAFTAISIAIIGLVVYIFNDVTKSTDGFTRYREMARDTVLSSRVQANMLMVRMNAKDYIKTTSQKDIDEFNYYYKRTKKFIDEAKKEIQKPSRAPLVSKIAKDLETYNNGFTKVIDFMKTRNDIVHNNLDVNGKRIEQLLTSVMNSAHNDGDNISSLETAKGIRSLLLARLYTAKYLASNSPEDAARVDKEFEDLSKNLDIIQSGLENPTRIKQLTKAINLINNYQIGVGKIVNIIKDRNEIIHNQLDVIGPEIAKLAEDVKLSIKKDQDRIGPEVAELNEAMEKALVIVGIGIVLFIIILSITLVQNSLVKPLSFLEHMVKDLSEGEGDLTKRLEVRGNNEISRISAYVNAFIEKVQTTVREAKTNSAENSSISEELSSTSLSIGKKVEEETKIVAQATEKGRQLQEVLSTSIAEAKDTKEEIVNTGKNLTDAKTQLAQLSNGVNENSVAEAEMAGKLQQLSADAEQVKGVLDVIADIADQTNLLALNAAIEAARAGEHGRGFAVVADEVRQLAERTQKSLAEINATINVIVQAISDTTEEITRNANNAELLAQNSSQVEQNIDESVTQMQVTIEDIESIINGYIKNSEATNEIILEIDQINEISSENARSVEEIAGATEHMAQMVGKLTTLLNAYKA